MKTWFVPGAVRLGMMSFWISWANPPMIILPTWVRYMEREGYSKNIDGWSDRCPGDEKMCRSYKRNFDIPDIGVSRLLVLGPTSVTITRLVHAIVDVSTICSRMKICVLIQCSGSDSKSEPCGNSALCSELKLLKSVNCSEAVTKDRKRSLPQHPLVIATLESGHASV